MFNAVKGLFGLANVSTIKLGLILAIVASLSTLSVWGYNSIYDAGYSKARVETLKLATEQREVLESTYNIKLELLLKSIQETKDRANKERTKALQLQSLLDNRPTVEIIHEIETTKAGDCTSFSPEYNKLLHNIIGTAPKLSQ